VAHHARRVARLAASPNSRPVRKGRKLCIVFFYWLEHSISPTTALCLHSIYFTRESARSRPQQHCVCTVSTSPAKALDLAHNSTVFAQHLFYRREHSITQIVLRLQRALSERALDFAHQGALGRARQHCVCTALFFCRPESISRTTAPSFAWHFFADQSTRSRAQQHSVWTAPSLTGDGTRSHTGTRTRTLLVAHDSTAFAQSLLCRQSSQSGRTVLRFTGRTAQRLHSVFFAGESAQRRAEQHYVCTVSLTGESTRRRAEQHCVCTVSSITGACACPRPPAEQQCVCTVSFYRRVPPPPR